ncbi:MAG TPA: hypothetical protein VFM18_23935 [Methanosarcina sp.]|nr:hypothetical protein [Methanosarcina sp.]
MLIFRNKSSGNYFAVENQSGTVTKLNNGHISLLAKLEGTVGPLEYLDLPDLKTVNEFRKHLKKGILKDVPITETKHYLKQHYPEYFI